ncbi:hypothetical protein VOLCADRAFT_96011 [Volvox carteri f. nagariensis]|uniref:Uncharacterized protein n=1 Tax=Volvox carteri f. nagariensis TaxID=3068 RepID=D8U8Z3_VOLCA|nr:uncharacterized protein VOLCADRAFT_96011 [Volvox carteri f. nagariensis]EFJ43833.1 hypothetical protein VOLCADRAFT_96011 [Volvox carteri f. nagariensis]|eukprot:XP_002955079.1 hypothetical protein VOLCADRAFT_96011 [Volvox carteri f. nagariensis]
MGAGASSKAPPRYKWDQDTTLRGPWTFIFKEKVQCACEGSKWCTRENPARQKTPNALPGLHCSWVGDTVLAMARPWQSHVVSYKLVEAFQQANIGMILNLQEVGEHASCGPGNLAHTGFTYDPETFMAGGVGYYNFAWRDMGVPSLDRMMDIVQVMDYVTRVEGRKIAVHCHAGLGRTGLAIACFFVFAGMYDTPEAAIAAVRKNRPGAVQTSRQVAFVTIFAKYLQHLRLKQGQQQQQQQKQQPPHSASVADFAAAAAGGGGGGGGDTLATRSAPLLGALPQEGLMESRETAAAVVGVYASGLTVTVPLQAGGDGGEAADGALTEDDLGLSQQLPWNGAFQIEPRHAAAFRPRPPRSYTEALSRQARALHGPERRAYLRLHKVVKETVFAIIAAAQAFQPHTLSRHSVSCRSQQNSLPAISEEGGRKGDALQKSKSRTGGGGGGVDEGSPKASPLPPTFAHLLSYLINHHGHNHVDSDALVPLMAHKAYAAAVGMQPEPGGPQQRPIIKTITAAARGPTQVESRAVLAAASQLRQEINAGQYDGVEPGQSAGGGAEPTLTPSCLSVISRSYLGLFNGHMPAPPSSGRPSLSADGNNGRGAENGITAVPAAAASSPSLEYARQAYEILEPLEPRDSELLLVFAAMLRVVARGSGPGSEDAVVVIGKWATRLLLGKLSRSPEAEEAVLSFLWYLAGRDEAYAMLVLLKRQRMSGLLSATQMAQLVSQDLQQLYRVVFREALAGIPSVAYPPPVATGRIDVHNVWR